MRAWIAYTGLRLALFALALGLLYLLGARGLLLVVVAALLSGLVSYPLLSRLRDRMSAAAIDRARRARERLEESAAAEDDD